MDGCLIALENVQQESAMDAEHPLLPPFTTTESAALKVRLAMAPI
jgi:hypothetical protein